MNGSSQDIFQSRLSQVRSYEPSEESERAALEQLWAAGRLQARLESLECFYRKSRQTFSSLVESNPDGGRIVEVAKLLVVDSVVVDCRAEATDQVREIEREIWIQGERGNHDRDRIASEWASHHAQSWRLWRIKEYLFAVERMESRLPEFLSFSEGPAMPQS